MTTTSVDTDLHDDNEHKIYCGILRSEAAGTFGRDHAQNISLEQ